MKENPKERRQDTLERLKIVFGDDNTNQTDGSRYRNVDKINSFSGIDASEIDYFWASFFL